MAHTNDSSFPIIPATEADRRRASITTGQQRTVATSLAHQGSHRTRFTATNDRIRPATWPAERRLRYELGWPRQDRFGHRASGSESAVPGCGNTVCCGEGIGTWTF